MKKICVIFFTLLFFFVTKSDAKIWRVNNNTGVSADFTTIQAAHDGASSNDTLYLEGSPSSYGSLTCNKLLYIIGPGYFLGQVPNTQALVQSAIVSGVTFNVGSAGSVIEGIDLNGNSVGVFAHNITIKRNKFSSPNGSNYDYSMGTINLYYTSNNSSIPVTNILITQNFGCIILINYPSTNVLITNNYISFHQYYGDATTNECLRADPNAVLLVKNNIFRRGAVNVSNSSVTNNIMYAGFFNGAGNLVSNNIGNSTQFGTINGNQSSVDMTQVFSGTGSPDQSWSLKAGSPAIGAGYGSTVSNPVDCGIYGGNTPYVVAGQVNMPAIYFFDNSPTGSNTDPIRVTVKVKSAGN